jgi:hypothetical protein
MGMWQSSNPGSRWTTSSIIALLLAGIALQADGADVSGSDGAVGTNVTIMSGSFEGGVGGLTQENDADSFANGGSGFRAIGNTTVSNGTFQGGDGGIAVSYKRAISANGGSGLLLLEGDSTIYDGIFAGGAAGSVATNIFGPELPGQAGAGVELRAMPGGTASLSIYGGIIQDGIKIGADTNAMVSLHLSTDTTVSGALVKQGGGTLGIRDWQAGTLQHVQMLEGTVALTNRYVLEAGGLVDLVNAGTEFQALEGMVVDGMLSSVAGSVVNVYSNMTVSGTIFGTVQLSGASGNTLVLRQGANVANATFSGNGTMDRLQLLQGGTYSEASLGMDTRYRGFERVELSTSADAWLLTTADIGRTGFTVDGGSGSGDLLAMAQGGTYAKNDFDTAHNTGFEFFGLSAFNDVWVADATDLTLGTHLDARGGVDEIDFSNRQVGSALIGPSAYYRNFEGIRLSAGNDIWSAAQDYSQLDFINASTGVDTLSYASFSSVDTNASEMGAASYFRGFEQVALTGAADTWHVTGLDGTLSSVDALGGLDTLSVAEVREWSAADALRYTGFEILDVTGGVLAISASQPLQFDQVRVSSGEIAIHAGASIATAYYGQESNTTFRFEATTNAVGTLPAGLLADTASFATGSVFQFYNTRINDFAVFNRYTNLVVDADMLIIGGATNSTDLTPLVIDESLISVKDLYVDVVNHSIYAIFDRRSLTVQAGVASNTPLGSILVEIDALKTPEADAMLSFINDNNISGEELADELSHVYQRNLSAPSLAFHQRNELLRQLRHRTADFRLQYCPAAAPPGAQGPRQGESHMAAWMKGYGSLGSGNGESVYNAYDVTLMGSILGVDASFGEWLLGCAGGVFSSGMAFENNDDLSAFGFHGSLYASHGVDGFFVESSLSASMASMESTLGSLFDVSSSYGSSDFFGYLGSGLILEDGPFRLVPDLGIAVNQYNQDGFTDSSDNIVPTEVDTYSKLGAQVQAGLAGSLYRKWRGKAIRASLKARWLHELVEADEQLEYRLFGGTEPHEYAVLSPSINMVDVGFGLSAQINRTLSLGLEVDYLVSSDFEAYHVDAGLIFGF